jgi:hypothetical protein
LVRFATGKDQDNNHSVYYRADHDEKWQPWQPKGINVSFVKLLNFSKDNDTVYFTANVDSGTRALFEHQLSSQQTRKLVHDKKLDINSVPFNYAKTEVISVSTDTGLPQYTYLDKTDIKAQLQQKLLAGFSGYNVKINSHSANGQKAIVYVYAANDPGKYLLYDHKTG